MSRIERKPTVIDGAEHILPYDKKEDRNYCRVESSIIFPAHAPGAIVVLAEERRAFYSGQLGALHVLKEHEGIWDMGGLLRRYLELRHEFRIENCITPPSPTSTNFLRTFNAQQREKRLEEVYLQYPPFYENGTINYHVQVLKEVLRNEARRLHFPEGSSIPGQLQRLPLGEEFNDYDYPLVAALAYITTKFIVEPYVMPTPETERVQT